MLPHFLSTSAASWLSLRHSSLGKYFLTTVRRALRETAVV